MQRSTMHTEAVSPHERRQEEVGNHEHTGEECGGDGNSIGHFTLHKAPKHTHSASLGPKSNALWSPTHTHSHASNVKNPEGQESGLEVYL